MNFKNKWSNGKEKKTERFKHQKKQTATRKHQQPANTSRSTTEQPAEVISVRL